MSDFDLVVVGGGPGGYVCAIRAAQLGLKTAVIERDRMGGECLNYGCIPSKAMIGVAKLFDSVSHGGRFGIHAEGLKLDFGTLQLWRANVVKTLVSGVEQLCKGNGVQMIHGEGSVTGLHSMNVTGGVKSETVTFKSLVLATGTRPLPLPNIDFDGNMVISSKEALELPRSPSSLLVVGGGVVGMEMACMYLRFGTSVTVVELTDRLLPGFDRDVVNVVQRAAEARGAKIYLQSKVQSVIKGDSAVTASIETPSGVVKVEASKMLLSVGRRPTTERLNLRGLGVKTDAKGFVQTDSKMMSNVPGIYAIGDVRGPPLLAHKASHEGVVAAEAAAGRMTEAQWKTVPDAVFTDPEVASAGLTEEAATAMGAKSKATRFQFAALGRAVASGETSGFVKIVSDPDSGAVLGVQIVGPDASDMISEAALAIEMGATVEDLALTIHPHPTFPEALMEAADSAAGHPIHQLRTKGA